MHGRPGRTRRRACSRPAREGCSGLDRDEQALELARERLKEWGDRVELVHADYRDLGRVMQRATSQRATGVLADLGVSSMQLDDAVARDSVFGRAGRSTCAWIGRAASRWRRGSTSVDDETLADVIYRFGEERQFAAGGALDSGGPRPRRAHDDRRSRRRRPDVARAAGSGSGSIRRRGRFRRCGSG